MRISTSLFNQRGLASILDQQSALLDIQTKIATGKRISSPSDDPSGSIQIIKLSEAKSVTEQYIRNSDSALSRLQLEESTIKSVEDTLLRVRELSIQSGNSILSNQDRKAIAIELRQHLQGLIGLANSQDANQDYLFAGNQVGQRPFSLVAGGNVAYNGDQGQRAIQISSGQQISDGDTGMAVFMDISKGNGKFSVQDSPTNTGAGIIDPGQVFDASAYVADDYTISFVTNASGNIGYNVVGAASGQLIPPLPQDPTLNAPDYVAGTNIRFNGVETKIEASPAIGDIFTITPSVKQDIFTTIDELATALETDAIGSEQGAKVQNQISASIVNLDRAMDKMSEIRSNIGARLKLVEDRSLTNESFLFDITTTLSDVQDLDLISAASELQQRLAALEASQAAFIRIQGLSLFNYIS
ncbi:MAG: flagellar hook-associated protein 3 FlgL [Planctomycetota bacterium]|jgi:flagellar hook-associated protein 3 FlgL